MAFKSMVEHNEERFKGLFLLPNDGDYADVVIMYRGVEDVMVADGVHYIISPEYRGYVHCCGSGCPACDNNIRPQTRLFIPVFVVNSNVDSCPRGEIVFFDRSTRFEAQLQQDVFSRYPNPSELVFRITRNGAAGDQNTRYSITAQGRNTLSYDQILAQTKSAFPEKYNDICRDVSVSVLQQWMNANSSSGGSMPTENANSSMPDYQISPRGVPINNNTVPPAVPVEGVASTATDSVNVAPPSPVDVPVDVAGAAPNANTPIVTPSVSTSIEPVEADTTSEPTPAAEEAVPEVDNVKF